MRIVSNVDIEQLALNLLEDMNDYSDFEDFLDAVDNEASDWDFAKIVRDWVKKQKKIAKKEGVDF